MKSEVLHRRIYKTDRYGKCSITVSAVESWNKIKKKTEKCST